MRWNLSSAPKALLLALASASLIGCSTDKDQLLGHDGRTMHDIWQAEAGDGGLAQVARRQLLDARQQLRRPLLEAELPGAAAEQARYTRTAANEIQQQFRRLPNPDLLMYVFPHLAGSDPLPVPGYSTVFPLYQRVQYAMPGERLEDY
ncbi:conjugative transfer region lipoprotein [Delftia tsuruhatensis]|uniref:TIGR03751 family conjugal transfer lipoprotein n=1 Tax=Delftia tsuruhatensis TaxID=180282 RepID=UPI001E749AF0|nr:TIGR03751 family conjugal transfer lipoprotein [Delftia tsuruhatensis]CAB5671099.1 conjugative transfer region lipoprotein [Delftia tsuruhatensis]CAC9683145.1 conjugative transfer region lipoprotein [Delftia tsuruhatensis]